MEWSHASGLPHFLQSMQHSCKYNPSNNKMYLKLPKPRLCCSVWANISYLRMSLSLTERRANRIASSKWSFLISGTGSSSSTSYEHRFWELPLCEASKAAAEQKCANVKRWIKRDRRSTDHGWWVGLPLPLPANLVLNALPDGQLTCPLADLCEICSREAIGHLCQEVQVHILTKKLEN